MDNAIIKRIRVALERMEPVDVLAMLDTSTPDHGVTICDIEQIDEQLDAEFEIMRMKQENQWIDLRKCEDGYLGWLGVNPDNPKYILSDRQRDLMSISLSAQLRQVASC